MLWYLWYTPARTQLSLSSTSPRTGCGTTCSLRWHTPPPPHHSSLITLLLFHVLIFLHRDPLVAEVLDCVTPPPTALQCTSPQGVSDNSGPGAVNTPDLLHHRSDTVWAAQTVFWWSKCSSMRGLWVSWPLRSSDVWFWNRGHYLRKSWTCICVGHTYRRVSGAVKQHVHDDHHYVGCRHIPRCSNRCIVQFSSLSSSKAAVLMSSARFWTNSSLQRTSAGLSVGWLELLWARQDVVMEGNDDNCVSSCMYDIPFSSKYRRNKSRKNRNKKIDQIETK